MPKSGFEKSGNLIFIGNPGVGKTHFAISIGIEACKQSCRVPLLIFMRC